ncbi:MAG: ABC transporter ATP-binding protein [Sulfolobaceae archaeon]
MYDINLYTSKKEIVAIIGPSGSGKSTLLRILGGFLKPSKGKVLLLGKEVSKPTPKIALVHQSIVTFPWMSALENIKLGLKYLKLSKEDEDRIARKMLDLVGLHGFEELSPKQMSGGMRQRIAIARALAAQPIVMLLDEPFSHLDEITAEGIRREIRNILFDKESSLESAVLVSHNLQEVVEIADRVYVLNGSPSTLIGEVKIDLPYPRSSKDPKFYEYIDILYKLLTPLRNKSFSS